MSDTAKQRTVLMLLQRMDDGGAQVLVGTLAPALRRRGWRPLVCCWEEGGARLDRLAAAGIDVRTLGLRRVSMARPLAFTRVVSRAVRLVSRLVVEEGVRIVHAHLHESNFLAAEVGARTGRPAVLTLHTVQMAPNRRPGTLRYRLRLAALRRAARRAAAVVAVGDSVAEAFRAVAPGLPIEIIRNGVRLPAEPGRERARVRRELGLDPDAQVLAIVGRLVPLKRHGDLLDALGALRRAGREATLLVVGDGPAGPLLRERARANGLDEAVRWLGRRDDVGALLDAADLFVLPSAWEGTSLALLEAMAAGRPVVASDVGGNAEGIEPGRSGLLVPPGDPARLAEAIACLLDDPARAAALGAAARTRVAERHDIELTVRRTVELYERLLARGRASRAAAAELAR